MQTPRPMLANAVVRERATPSGVSGRVALAALAGLLLTGLWVRFHEQVVAVLPAWAMGDLGYSGAPADLVELALMPERETAEAVAAMGLSAVEGGALTDALRRRRLRLVRMPVFDAQPDPSAPPRVVRVNAGGYATTVTLGAHPVVLTLPVGPVGRVRFSAAVAGAGFVAVGALTLDGPIRFPDLPAGHSLEVGVMAQ